MVRKIYTRSGDRGETALFAGGRIAKDDARLVAIGAVDELNATLGLALALEPSPRTAARLKNLQGQLFTLGADLATPNTAKSTPIPRLAPEAATALEADIDALADDLAPLTNFILPGGTPSGAALHLARTVCRRAERAIVTLAIETELNAAILPYINRLSDWLFTLTRWENQQAGTSEAIWEGDSGG